MKRLLIVGVLVLAGLMAWPKSRARLLSALILLRGRATVAERVVEFGPSVERRVRPAVEKAGLTYPPEELTLVAFKDQRVLWVYARNSSSTEAPRQWVPIKSYPVLGQSGGLGPKLKEGDYQVPEGLYRAESLNPNSRFHLAIRVNYPNVEDQERGAEDGRDDLGSDIMIHGGDSSTGCLAMGDEAAEELFILAAHAGVESVQILLCPGDLRLKNFAVPEGAPAWVADRYAKLKEALSAFP